MRPGPIQYCERLDRMVRKLLPGSVVGTYLHGSAALGGFVVGKSDVDVLFVVGDKPTPIDWFALGEAIAEAAEPCPGRGIEASVVTLAQARSAEPPWNFVIHLTTERGDRRIVPGTSHPGDADLPMHYAVTIARGIAISGPPPREVFGAPSRSWILEYLADELHDSMNGPLANLVLNACRAWQFLETGELVSKVAGAQWAPTRCDDRGVIMRALAQHLGAVTASVADDAGRRFAADVRARLTADESG